MNRCFFVGRQDLWQCAVSPLLLSNRVCCKGGAERQSQEVVRRLRDYGVR